MKRSRPGNTQKDLFNPDTPPSPLSPAQERARVAYVGVDPGASGGIAVCVYEGEALWCVYTHSMPSTEEEILDTLQSYQLSGITLYAVIEAVTGYVAPRGTELGADGKGGGHANAHRMFTFGQNYGSLRMALTALDIPFKAIASKTWQNGMHIPPRKRSESKGEWKNRLKKFAEDLYGRKVTLKTADALLLSAYARLIWTAENVKE